MTANQLRILMLIIEAVSHYSICTECAREIDFRNFDCEPSERGHGNFRHRRCPPRVIFYT